MGCIETFISGLGIERLAHAIMGTNLSPPDLIERRASDEAAAKTWRIWCDLTADHIRNLTLTVDPDIIILGGGLSKITGVLDDLKEAQDRNRIGDFGVAKLALAEGGDTSGARGAAYAAWQNA